MKIISGSKKSYIISAPKNLPVRPTSGLVKESLFNILSNYFNFNKAKVLDLFAGTGNISYEFVSRGCKSIDSVDINSRCTRFIRKKSLELGLKINVLNLSVNRFLNKNQLKYDIIFADPPYQFTIEDYTDLIDSIFDLASLTSEGLLVIEHEKKFNLVNMICFILIKSMGEQC